VDVYDFKPYKTSKMVFYRYYSAKQLGNIENDTPTHEIMTSQNIAESKLSSPRHYKMDFITLF
jgi:hypothetical protein